MSAPAATARSRPFPGDIALNIDLYREGAVLHHAAVVAHMRGDYAESERKHREALALRRTDASPDACYDLAQTLGALSGTLLKMDRHDDAAAPCEECIVHYNDIIEICRADMAAIAPLIGCIRARVPPHVLPAEAAPIVPAWIGNPQNYHGDATGACPVSQELRDASKSSSSTSACPLGFSAPQSSSSESPQQTASTPASRPQPPSGYNGSRHKPGAKSSDLNRLIAAAGDFNAGHAHAAKGAHADAAECFGRCATVRKEELEDDDWFEVALALAAQGRCLLRAGNLTAAFSALSESLAVYTSVIDAMHANASGFLVFLADVRNRQQRFDDAERLLLDALRLVVLIPGKPMESYTHMKLAELYEGEGRIADALSRYEQAVDTMYPHQLKAPKGADLLNRLGCCRMAVANALLASGEECDAIASAVGRRADGAAPEGHVPTKAERQAQAVRLFNASLETFSRAEATYARLFGPSYVEIATVNANAAEALQALGRLDEALAKHAAALAIREKAHGVCHPLVAYAHFGRGKVLLEMEKFGVAKEAFLSAGKAIGMRVDSIDEALEGFAPFMAAMQGGGDAQFDVVQQILYGLYEARIGLSNAAEAAASSVQGP